MKKMKKFGLLLPLSLMVGFTKPPQNTDNICRIFQANPTWHAEARQTETKWGIPVAVQMAIINQESHFNAQAKAQSSAYGFSQALTHTWASYQKQTGSTARRDEFTGATDFIGWYANMAKQDLGISEKDTYDLYLAYHEGLGGYKSHSYTQKPMIMNIANAVHQKADIYQAQLASCQA